MDGLETDVDALARAKRDSQQAARLHSALVHMRTLLQVLPSSAHLKQPRCLVRVGIHRVGSTQSTAPQSDLTPPLITYLRCTSGRDSPSKTPRRHYPPHRRQSQRMRRRVCHPRSRGSPSRTSRRSTARRRSSGTATGGRLGPSCCPAEMRRCGVVHPHLPLSGSSADAVEGFLADIQTAWHSSIKDKLAFAIGEQDSEQQPSEAAQPRPPPPPCSFAIVEAARREQALAARRQATALNLVVLGEVLRILRPPVYALALRR